MLIPPPSFLPPSPAAVPRRKWTGPALAVCALALLSGPAVRGDIQKASKADSPGERSARRQENPPPSAVAGNARVNLDGSVEIVLQANGGESHEVDFLIRQPPAHGTLAGPPRQLTRNTAAVTYVHRAGDGPQGDVFTFAVQIMGGKVSAAQPVAVGVIDIAPDLVATPAELDFGAVNAGDTSGAQLTVENRGGGVAAGVFAPPAPWEVDGPSNYHLAHGERRTFPLVFRPVRGESFSETVRFPGKGEGRSVRLIGIGLGTAAAPVAPSEPVPPPATPDARASTPPPEAPRAESTPAPAASVITPIESARPANPPPAAATRTQGGFRFGLVTPLVALAGLVLVACAALFARRRQGRRMSSREPGRPDSPLRGRGVPARERISR